MKVRININNYIRASEVRLLDEEGGNLGIVKIGDALKMAMESGKDLLEVGPNSNPPVAKIMDYGKYLYLENKKQKGTKTKSSETKNLQVKIGTGDHDLELKAKKASEFLKEGNRVKIDLFLRGRAQYLDKNFLQARLERILHLITEGYKIVAPPSKSPKGLTVIIEKDRTKKIEPMGGKPETKVSAPAQEKAPDSQKPPVNLG
ncbi:MAG: translation initiation factor IF-3 [Candidatus Paceibacterota bacterium]